jgi:hypothetical protein
MSLVPVAALASAVFGCVSGAISGYRDSWTLAGQGAIFGFLWGIGCFIGLAFPYAWFFTRVEMPENVWSMSKTGRALFVPVMIVIFAVAILGPWYGMGLSQ